MLVLHIAETKRTQVIADQSEMVEVRMVIFDVEKKEDLAAQVELYETERLKPEEERKVITSVVSETTQGYPITEETTRDMIIEEVKKYFDNFKKEIETKKVNENKEKIDKQVDEVLALKGGVLS